MENHRKTMGKWWFNGDLMGFYGGFMVIEWDLLGFYDDLMGFNGFLGGNLVGLSENVEKTPKPNGFADHYPYEKWLFHWE